MIAKHPPEQYRSFNFLVELDGVVLGGFSEVSGLGTEALVVDYRLEVDRLGHRVGTQQRIAGIFPASLSAQLAREGSRTTTELVAPALATDTTVRFKLPASAKVVGVPKPTNATFQGARFSSQAQASGTEVTLTRSVRVPIMRVPAPSYPALASFCRTVDVAEASELAVELP